MTDYPTPVFLAVLASAVFHAAWNALIRGGKNPLFHTAAIVFWAGLLAAPLLLFVTPPTAASLPYLGISNIVHMLYYVALAAAYKSGVLSFAYPIIRGSAPLLIALASLVLLAEIPGPVAWGGIFCISAGILAIAMRAGVRGSSKTILWSLVCAVSIATYSVADALGVRHSGSVAGYGALMYTMEALLFIGGLSLFGRAKGLGSHILTHWRGTLLGGIMSAGAYWISLWAVTQAPVMLVAATRETSVLFAALIGVLFMNEKLTLRQWLGAAAIVGGAMLLRSG